MPPQARLEYTTLFPLNNKWTKSDLTPNGMRNDLEYSFSLSQVYNFSFDLESEETETRWAENMKSGDVTAKQNLRAYGGRYDFRGQGSPTGAYTSTGELLPADTPRLRGDVRVTVAATAVQDVLSCRATPKGWPSEQSSITELLELFEPIVLDWDLTPVMGKGYVAPNTEASLEAGIPMQPGYGYVLSATLQIRPGYTKSESSEALIAWTTKIVAKSAVRYRLPVGQGHLFQVTYNVRVDDAVYPSIDSNSFSFISLLVSYGAAFGYYSVGISLIMLWNIIQAMLLEAWQRESERQVQTMKAINVSDEYLEELTDYIGNKAISTADHAKLSETHIEQKRLGSTAYCIYEAMQKKVGRTNLVLFQVMHGVHKSPEAGISIREKELILAYREETRKGPLSNYESLWAEFWDILDDGGMYPVLYKILKKEYVDQYRKNASIAAGQGGE